MKYLFEAIERRYGNNDTSSKNGSTNVKLNSSRVRLSAVELKKLVLEASEGVDDKSSANDFVDTLERIVNEIKNTTEHSTAFLQKVRKTDVPDYYEVIKHPMDLSTLAKRVKQQMYRTKKAFADDLDLIWSNCLLYNSHPGHPLRRSAEFLRAKSNQLLEFISDPALPARSLYAQTVAAQVGAAGRNRGSARGTPAPGDEADGEADNESESGARARSVSVALGRHSSILQAANERLLNGVNGDSRDRSASPMGSGVQTPIPGAVASRKIGRGPLGRTPSPTPTPEPEEIAFEDRPALVRTATGMLDFTLLDDELSRFDAGLDRNPIASTSSLKLSNHASKSALIPETLPESNESSQATLYRLVHSLNPAAYPSPPPSTAPTTLDSNSSGTNGDASPPSNPTSTGSSRIVLDDSPDSLWWETIALNPELNPSLTGFEAPITPSWKALSAGIPICPWKAVAGTEEESSEQLKPVARESTATTAKVNGKGKGKGKARTMNKRKSAANGRAKAQQTAQAKVDSSVKKTRKSENGALSGLGRQMRRNTETLHKIRRLHRHLSSGTRTPPSQEAQSHGIEADFVIPLIAEHSLSDTEDAKRPKPSSYLESGIPASAFRSRTAPHAARQSMNFVTSRVLEHTGFEGSSSTALGVISHVASEYIANLGRTMRFFADRFGGKMSTEEILLHALGENGVGSANDLRDYVKEDIVEYGRDLKELHAKLEKARRKEIEAPEIDSTILEKDILLEDGEVSLGKLSVTTDEDLFGLASSGLEQDFRGATSLSIPSRLLRGDAASLEPTVSDYPELTSSSVSALPGLLHPYFLLRAKTSGYGLLEDSARRSSSFLPRAKVSPSTGKISTKAQIASKRKFEELVASEGMPVSTLTIITPTIDVGDAIENGIEVEEEVVSPLKKLKQANLVDVEMEG